jgi:protein SCO1/2
MERKVMSRVARVVAIAEVVVLAWFAVAWTEARAEQDEHAHHHHHAATAPAMENKRSVEKYAVPALNMIRQDGSKVNFQADIDDGRPVMLNFIYTSCTAICPVTTQVFSQVQEKLGADKARLHMVSVSIDPEFDSPARLDAYARKYNAGTQWQFYTGTREASIAIQKAFGAYRGDKMNHVAVTYVRAAPGKPWIRLDGMRGPDDILKEIRAILPG